jgi:hypothetical protein
MVDGRTKFMIFKRAERVVTSGLSFDIILEQLADLVIEVTEAKNCAVFMSDGEGNLLLKVRRGEMD